MVKVTRELSIGIRVSRHSIIPLTALCLHAVGNGERHGSTLCGDVSTGLGLGRGTLTSLAPAPQTQRSVSELVKR